jgi:NADPH-dependent curcumin reductase CurA
VLRSEVVELYITLLIMPSLPTQNRRVVLAERPDRGPITEKTFNLETAKIGDLEDGQILVKVLYTSIVSTVVIDYHQSEDKVGSASYGIISQ